MATVGNSVVSVSLPNIKIPLTDGRGNVQQQWWRFFQAIYTAVGPNPVDTSGLETQIAQVSAVASGAAVIANSALETGNIANTNAAGAQATADDALALQALAFDAKSPTEPLLPLGALLALDAPEASVGPAISLEGETYIHETKFIIGDDLYQEVEDLREQVKQLRALIYALNTGTS